jgi:hypothetical protein
MRLSPPFRAVAAALGLLASSLAHADLFVISNEAVQIEPGDVRSIYRGEKLFDGATKLVPVDNGPAQEAFLSHVMRMDAPRYNTIWTKKSFREGLIPPPVKSGDLEVIEFVRKTPGAVGYVASPPSGVTVVNRY